MNEDIIVSQSPALPLNSLQKMIFECCWPLNSIFITTDSANPNTLLTGGDGSVWEKIQNRFLLGSGSKNVGVTGGEETVTLTINQIPSHTHNASTNTTGRHNHSYYTAPHIFFEQDTSQDAIISPPRPNSSNAVTKETYYNGDHSHTVTVNATGGSQSHNNMPPYLVVNIWKRVG